MPLPSVHPTKTRSQRQLRGSSANAPVCLSSKDRAQWPPTEGFPHAQRALPRTQLDLTPRPPQPPGGRYHYHPTSRIKNRPERFSNWPKATQPAGGGPSHPLYPGGWSSSPDSTTRDLGLRILIPKIPKGASRLRKGGVLGRGAWERRAREAGVREGAFTIPPPARPLSVFPGFKRTVFLSQISLLINTWGFQGRQPAPLPQQRAP